MTGRVKFSFSVPLPVIDAEETVRGSIPALPEAAKLEHASIHVGTANCTGAYAALSAIIQNGTTDLTETLALHATNDEQNEEFVLVATDDLNCAAGDQIDVEVTGAGGDTSAATGIVAYLSFGLPLKP